MKKALAQIKIVDNESMRGYIIHISDRFQHKLAPCFMHPFTRNVWMKSYWLLSVTVSYHDKQNFECIQSKWLNIFCSDWQF